MTSGLYSLKERYGLAGVYLQLMPVLRALEKENGQQEEKKVAAMESVRWLIEQLISENKQLNDQLESLDKVE
jgi:hypothetical protein